MSGNLAASIRARLLNRAKATKEDFNLILTRYGLERLLYRLSVSPHAERFLLKGALLFSLWYDQPHRPTRDADLLAFGTDNIDAMVVAFREICGLSVDDGLAFDIDGIKGGEIRKAAGYSGIRIDVRANLDGANISLQVDIGFGDAVTPGPEDVNYPVLLDDLPAFALKAYPKYTVVAEKVHAICLLGMANTRLKDYFDLDVLLSEGVLDQTQLKGAVEATFARRKLDVPSDWPVGLTDTFASDAGKQTQWTAFLRKNRLQQMPLHEVVGRIRSGLSMFGSVVA
jgi:Nucleotidyl transferase AbiEii toxin, Type IV TA system